VVGIGAPERVIVQVNVLDVKYVGFEKVCTPEGSAEVLIGLFSLLFFLFFDPKTAPTITARRAKNPMIMIISPLFVR